MKNPFKAFGRLVAAFPFAGKVAIRPMYRGYRNASSAERPARFLGLSKLLSLLVFGHGAQARMGLVALKAMFAKKVSFLWMTVFLGYTVANVAVAVAQFTLLIWAVYTFLWVRDVTPGKPDEQFTARELLLMFVVTFGGQMLFAYGRALYV